MPRVPDKAKDDGRDYLVLSDSGYGQYHVAYQSNTVEAASMRLKENPRYGPALLVRVIHENK